MLTLDQAAQVSRTMALLEAAPYVTRRPALRTKCRRDDPLSVRCRVRLRSPEIRGALRTVVRFDPSTGTLTATSTRLLMFPFLENDVTLP